MVKPNKATATVMSVVLAMGLCPMPAMAASDADLQAAGAGSAVELLAVNADTTVKADRLYTVDTAWNKEDGSEGSSMGRHMQQAAELRYVDGAYDIRIKPAESSDASIADITYNGKSLEVVSDEGVSPRTFKLVVDSIDEPIPMGISVNAGPMGIMNHGVQLVIDADSAELADPELEQGKTYAVPMTIYKDGTYDTAEPEASMAGGFLGDSAVVEKKGDGAYSVKVTVPASNQVTFEKMTYGAGDVEAEATAHEDGSTTFDLSFNNLYDVMRVGFTYTPAALGRSMTHYADMVLNTASVEEAEASDADVADKTALEGAIAAANALNADDYYAATWKLVADQLEVAGGLMADDAATQEDVDAAAARLNELLVEGAGGYLVKKSTVSNPEADGPYKVEFTAYNASGYGTGTRALAEFQMSRQFDPNILLEKSGDDITMTLLYGSTIDMVSVALNDVAGEKVAVGDLAVANRDGSTSITTAYTFKMNVADLAADNKLSFTYDTGMPNIGDNGKMTSSVYLVATSLGDWDGYAAAPFTHMEAGKHYQADSAVLKADSEEKSMADGLLNPWVRVIPGDDGKYTVKVSTSNETAIEQHVKVFYADGTDANDVSTEDEIAYELAVDNIAEPINIQFGADAMPAKQSARLVVDLQSIEEKVTPMFRLYNHWSGEHFYTASVEERDGLVGLGWTDEGLGWIAPDEGYGDKVYRLYNPYAGDHHYTSNAAEKENLVSLGWKDEGIGWYSDAEQRVQVMREYNPNELANNHNYTPDQEEHNFLVSIGWNDEGIGWYAAQDIPRSEDLTERIVR